MKSKNYTYGLLKPSEGRELVVAQLAAAARYRNKLVEVELRRREQTDATVRQHVPGLLETESELAEVAAAIDDALSAQRDRNRKARGLTDDSNCRAALADLKARRKALAAARKRLRSDGFASATCQAALAAVNSKAAAEVRAARAACGLYWGTYLLVEQAADAFRKGSPPVYRGYRGEGSVAVQLQGGLSWEDATSGRDTRLRIQHTPQQCERYSRSGTPLPVPGKRRRDQQYTLWLRVGSDGRAPIWATWPLILHRSIPDQARIMWAIVQRRIVGGKERWKLTLSLRGETDAAFSRNDLGDSGVVGIDIGYRYLGDREQRVAYWHGGDNESGELRLPSDKVAQWEKVDDLQAIRDGLHNAAKSSLREWMAANEHPEWLDEATEHIHAWRRLSRLDRLVVEWRKQRFDGDEEIMATLESWRSRERHLWQYQEQMRDQLLAWRKDLYRTFAASLRRKYQTIAIEDMDLRSAIHDVLRPVEDRETFTPQRRAARFAALSTLVGAIKDSGAEVLAVDREGTTSTCNACGAQNEVGENLLYTCCACGREWDRDDNAARNICARGAAAIKTRQSLASQSGKEVTSLQADQKKLSRSQRLAAARKKKSAAVAGKDLE